jgi:copper chaperone CopZ
MVQSRWSVKPNKKITLKIKRKGLVKVLFFNLRTMKNVLYFFLALTLFACGNATPNAEATPAATTNTVVDGTTKTEAVLSISGMTCAAGCGGKIQKELQNLHGVVTTSLDFVEDRDVNVVKVEFDPNVVKEIDMTTIVNTIADGQYHVVKAEIISHKAS